MTTYAEIDDAQIKDKISKLESRLDQLRDKKYKIMTVQHTLDTIKSVYTDKTDPTTAQKPIDPQLGTTMSDERRLAIYQGCMAEADKLLQKTV